MEITTFGSIDGAFERLKNRAAEDIPGLPERRRLLKSLQTAVLSSSDEIKAAVLADFQKSTVEAELTEIATVLLELRSALSKLEKWAAPRRIRAGFPFWTTRSEVVSQPKGIVLIISPWNYPILLSLAPVISAIAAGNRIVLKPSERTPNTSAFLARLLDQALGPDWCEVVQGDATVGAYLLTKPFNHFFFTGSPEVGQIVMKAAAGHWSGSTLELGGKSPAIVDASADIQLAADKIIIGKYLNAGQTCIAPDFVLAHETVYDELVQALVEHAATIDERNTASMTGIIDSRHVAKLKDLWDDARTLGAHKAGSESLDLGEVSVITDVPVDAKIMREEIFGPLLPVLRYSSLGDIDNVVAKLGPPLTTYLFTRNARFAQAIKRTLKTGSICQNEMLLHFAHPNLPFGGIGKSGNGRTHGQSGFRAFSDEISVLEQRWGRGILPLIFPPTRQAQHHLRSWLLKFLGW